MELSSRIVKGSAQSRQDVPMVLVDDSAIQ